MSQTHLSNALQGAVDFIAAQTGRERSDVITRLADSVDAARSTVRQDVLGYIKQPDIERLRGYTGVLGFTLDDLVRVASKDGLDYDPSWHGLKTRDTARNPGDIEFSDTRDSESWEKPTWSDWKSALDLDEDATWDSVDSDVRAQVASGTAFGDADADTFGDANTYPLVDPPSTLVLGALDSAWKLAGRAPDPDGLRSTIESLANEHFDTSFEEDESAMTEAPNAQIKSAAPDPELIDPFVEKIDEDDTEFKGSRHAEVKDVDRSSNVVEVYYAAWTEDAEDERFEKGAFEQSIKNFGPPAEKQRIVHLNQHMTQEPIGVPLEMHEDDHGLFSRTKISETRLGEDVLTLYQDGVITEHSVGFKRRETQQQEDGPTIIKDAMLLEGSNVTWGANSDTPFMGFKSAENAVPALADRLKSLRSALREGLTDRVAKHVEQSIGHVESNLRTLLDESADAFEDTEETNATPVKEEDLTGAIDAFQTQIEKAKTTNAFAKAADTSERATDGDIGPDDLLLDTEQEKDDIIVPDDMTLFGGTNA